MLTIIQHYVSLDERCWSAQTELCVRFAGLQSATEQLPIVGDSKMQADVHMLLAACQAAGADAWVLPLSLLLEDTNSLAGMAHPCCCKACVFMPTQI